MDLWSSKPGINPSNVNALTSWAFSRMHLLTCNEQWASGCRRMPQDAHQPVSVRPRPAISHHIWNFNFNPNANAYSIEGQTALPPFSAWQGQTAGPFQVTLETEFLINRPQSAAGFKGLHEWNDKMMYRRPCWPEQKSCSRQHAKMQLKALALSAVFHFKLKLVSRPIPPSINHFLM